MKPFRLSFITAQVLSVAVIVLLATLLPGIGALWSACGLMSVWGIAAGVYHLCPWRSHAGWWVLLAAMTFEAAAVTVNMWYFTTASGWDASLPLLLNDDAGRVWENALWFLGRGGYPPDPTQAGYPILVAAQMALGGVGLALPLLFNTLCVMLTIIATGAIATEADDHNRRIGALSMGLMALMCYFMASGSILIKDAVVCASTAAALLGMLRSARQGRYWLHPLTLTGVLMLTLVRPNMLFFMLIAAILLLYPRRRALVASLLCIVVLWCAAKLWLDIASKPWLIVASDERASLFWGKAQHQAWVDITGDYTVMPWWRKLMFLPASVLVQFVIPFPWNFSRDIIFGPVSVWSHLGYTWYAAGAVFVYMAVNLRRAPSLLARCAIWAIIAYVGTAYITAGTVSRYALPLLSAVIPCVAWALLRLRGRGLWIWLTIAAVGLTAGLLVCHHLQMQHL